MNWIKIICFLIMFLCSEHLLKPITNHNITAGYVLRHVRLAPIRDQIHVSCITRQILYCLTQPCVTTGKTISSAQFSCSVVSDFLWPHESQHARPACLSPTPGVHSNLIHRVSDAIQPSHPLSSPFPPAPKPSQHQSLFQRVNSSYEVAKVLEFQL